MSNEFLSPYECELISSPEFAVQELLCTLQSNKGQTEEGGGIWARGHRPQHVMQAADNNTDFTQEDEDAVLEAIQGEAFEANVGEAL